MNKVNRNIKTYLLIVVGFIASACTTETEIQFPVEVGENPESITKGFDGNYYVTLINGQQEGDGEVVEISGNEVKPFASGFNDPKGIVFLNDHLYLSDVTRVWRVNSTGETEIFANAEDFPEDVRYLNDVAVDENESGIYVTDMGDVGSMRDENNNLWPLDSAEADSIAEVGRVYHIDLSGNISVAQDTSPLMLNPNGVGVDNTGNIMIGAFFLGNFLVKRNGELTPLEGQFRGADAVEQDTEGNYYISSWALGTVWKIDGGTEESTVLIEGLETAADFYLEEDKGRLLLPDMRAGIIYTVEINK